jgi:uncharacterized membrane protein
MNEIRGETTIMLQVPSTVVYDYLLDFTRHPEWVQNLSRVTKVTDGPIGVGTTFKAQEGPPPVSARQKLRMMVYFIRGVMSGAKSYSVAEITALEPGRRIAWTAGIPKGNGYFNAADWEFILEPMGQGTRLIQRFTYRPQEPAAAKMVGVAGMAGIEKACAVNLGRLKARLEQPAGQLAGQTA